MFEAAMARRATGRATNAGISEALARQGMQRPGFDVFMRSARKIHSAIARVSGKWILAALGICLFTGLSEFHNDDVRARGLDQLTLAAHRTQLAAIEAGDVAETSRQLRSARTAPTHFTPSKKGQVAWRSDRVGAGGRDWT